MLITLFLNQFKTVSYVKNHDLQEVRVKQNEILNAYRRDISKHTTATESMRIGQVLQSLPSQLAKENKKFRFIRNLE